MASRKFAILLTIFLTCASGAAEPRLAAPTFVLHKAEGPNVSGALQELGDGWSVAIEGRVLARVPGDQVVSLRRADKLLPPFPTGQQVLFPNGDRLAGAIGGIAKERVAFTAASGSELSLSLSNLSVVWLSDPTDVEDVPLLRRRLLAGQRKHDVVHLRNGDTIDGNLTGLDTETLRVEVDRKETTIERGKVAYVALNSELARVPKPKGAYARVTLADGSRLSLASARCDTAKLTGKTLTGATVSIPLEQVLAVDVRQGRAIHLSELKPASYKHTPWGPTLTWPWVADGSVGGHDLRVGGATYDNGLGLHCTSEITYALGGEYKRFEAMVGLDDRGGKEGAVRVRVLVDGKAQDLGLKKDLTAAEGALRVQANVAGARELTLVVERGREGWWDRQGHVNWVDARLIK